MARQTRRTIFKRRCTNDECDVETETKNKKCDLCSAPLEQPRRRMQDMLRQIRQYAQKEE